MLRTNSVFPGRKQRHREEALVTSSRLPLQSSRCVLDGYCGTGHDCAVLIFNCATEGGGPCLTESRRHYTEGSKQHCAEKRAKGKRRRVAFHVSPPKKPE